MGAGKGFGFDREGWQEMESLSRENDHIFAKNPDPSIRIEIYSDPHSVVAAGVRLFMDRCSRAIARHGRFDAALSGGKTPEPFFKSLAENGERIPWNKINIFMVDERMVPYGHPDSNWGMIRRLLVDRIEIPEKNLHPIPFLESPDKTVETYSSELEKAFGIQSGSFPEFDLMMMGLGSDGHTASLFPGTAALSVTDRSVVHVHKAPVPYDRISVSLPVIHRALCRLFMVTGLAKAERIRDILISRSRQYPATLACEGKGETIFILDHDAASMIED